MGEYGSTNYMNRPSDKKDEGVLQSVGRHAYNVKEGWKAAADIVSEGVDRGLYGLHKGALEIGKGMDKQEQDIKKQGPIQFNTESLADLQNMYKQNLVSEELASGEKTGALVDKALESGMTSQDVVKKINQEVKDPTEVAKLEAQVKQKAGVESTGPVNSSDINATTEKVRANREGKDPTVSNVPENLDGEIEEAKNPYGAMQAAADATASQMYAKSITPQNWYESQPFNMGLIRFGLGLLSGEDYATAFSNAANDYTNLSGREKRESYADQLIAEGYTQQSVMQWIDEGKANILNKPEVKDAYEQFRDKEGNLWERNVNDKQLKKIDEAAKPVKRDTQIVGEVGQQRLVDMQTGETIEYFGPKGTGGKGGSGKGPSEQEVKTMSTGTYSSMYNEEAAENPLVYESGFVSEVGKKVGGLFAGSPDEYGRMAAEGDFGENARARQAGQDARRQFIERDLRLATGAVIAAGEAQPWISNLFTMSKEELTNGVSERKKAARHIIMSQASAVSMGATNKVLSIPQVRMLINGHALPMYDPADPSRTAIIGLMKIGPDGKPLVGKDGAPVVEMLNSASEETLNKLRSGVN